MAKENYYKEEFKVSGKDLKEKIKQLIKAGNVHRIVIKNESGNEIIVIPVNLAVVGAILAPTLAAVGAIATFLASCTVVVEKQKKV